MKKYLLQIIEALLTQHKWLLWLLESKPIKHLFFNKFILYRPHLFEQYYSWKPAWRPSKTIIILKPDALGDYIIFRKYLMALMQAEHYKNFRFVLVANAICKELIAHDFKHTQLTIHATEVSKFTNPADAHYRVAYMLNLNEKVYHTLIYWTFSRTPVMGDWLAKHLTARHKIALKGDLQCQTAEEREHGNAVYTQLIEPPADIIFEPDRNKWLCEQILGQKVDIDIPTVQISHSGYAVVMPGASAAFRRWPAENFAEVCRQLVLTFQKDVYVAGSPAEVALCDAIVQNSGQQQRVHHVCGKLSLPELQELVAKADILVGNESAGIHLAAELGIKAVCISNGNHYGRFNPYEYYGKTYIKTIYPPPVEDLSHSERLARYYAGSTEDIAQVSVARVLAALEELLD